MGHDAESNPGRDVQRKGLNNGYVFLGTEETNEPCQDRNHWRLFRAYCRQGLVEFVKAMAQKPEDIQCVVENAPYRF